MKGNFENAKKRVKKAKQKVKKLKRLLKKNGEEGIKLMKKEREDKKK